MKKVTSILLAGFISIGLLTGCGKKEEIKVENDDKVINQIAQIKDVKVKKLDIVDFVITNENNVTSIYFSVENNTSESIKFDTIECEMYDKNDSIIYIFNNELGELQPGEYKDINVNLATDLSSLDHVKYNVE